MRSNQSGEGDIRMAMSEADAVDCMTPPPKQPFSPRISPTCLWVPAATRTLAAVYMTGVGKRCSSMPAKRARRSIALGANTDEEAQKIADAHHTCRGESGAGECADMTGFPKSAPMDGTRKSSTTSAAPIDHESRL